MEKIESGIYLYCIAASDRLMSLSCRGIEENTDVCSKRFDDLCFVYSHVKLHNFTGASGDDNMRNIEWVSPRAVAHEKVVRHVMKMSPVYPIRFATIFSSMESLEKQLEPYFSNISIFLHETNGKGEYSLKGFLIRKKMIDFLSKKFFAFEIKALDEMLPGKRYFEKQKLIRRIESGVDTLAKEALENFLNSLISRFKKYKKRKPLSGDLCGDGSEMVFNLAFLIKDTEQEIFRNQIAQSKADLEDKGLVIRLTGPWPPYSFCKNIEARQS